jgi:hypothetical protein
MHMRVTQRARMPAIPNVVRRGAAYYWRRRVPAPLAESKRPATLTLALRTCDPRRARFLRLSEFG